MKILNKDEWDKLQDSTSPYDRAIMIFAENFIKIIVGKLAKGERLEDAFWPSVGEANVGDISETMQMTAFNIIAVTRERGKEMLRMFLTFHENNFRWNALANSDPGD